MKILRRKRRFVDIGNKRFVRSKYFYITSVRVIDITRPKTRYMRRVNIFEFYIQMFKAHVQEAVNGIK